MTSWHYDLTTTEKGVIGTVTSIGSSVFSMLPHLETTLRVAGLCVGLAVGVVTLISVLHDLRTKQKITKITKEKL
jgi:zinc transporter ZupT